MGNLIAYKQYTFQQTVAYNTHMYADGKIHVFCVSALELLHYLALPVKLPPYSSGATPLRDCRTNTHIVTKSVPTKRK